MSSSFYPTLPPINKSVSETSANVKLTQQSPQLEVVIRVVNTGSKPVYLSFGENSMVAASSTTGMVVLPQALPEYINWPENWTYLAYACAAGDTSTLQVIQGRKGK